LRSRVAIDKMAAMLESVPQAPARQWQSDKMMKSPQVDTILQVGLEHEHGPHIMSSFNHLIIVHTNFKILNVYSLKMLNFGTKSAVNCFGSILIMYKVIHKMKNWIRNLKQMAFIRC
jgi:hypothetical protein